MGVVRLKEFEEGFEPEELEIYALISTDVSDHVSYSEDYVKAHVFTAAIMECEEIVPDRREGILTWIIPKDHKDKGFDLEKFQVCRLRVRKCKKKKLTGNRLASENNRYLVLEMLECKEIPKCLENLKAFIRKPEYYLEKLHEFRYTTFMDCYCKETSSGKIFLESDSGSIESCVNALVTWERYENEISALDQKLRKCAADHLLENANNWAAEDGEEPMDEQTFMQRMIPDSLMFHNDGTIEAYYMDDDMFLGHMISVTTDENGNGAFAGI